MYDLIKVIVYIRLYSFILRILFSIFCNDSAVYFRCIVTEANVKVIPKEQLIHIWFCYFYYRSFIIFTPIHLVQVSVPSENSVNVKYKYYPPYDLSFQNRIPDCDKDADIQVNEIDLFKQLIC